MKREAVRQNLIVIRIFLPLVLAAFFGLSNVYAQRSPIDVNLIIDASSSFSGVKDEITSWVSGRLDQILVDGDKLTIWSAGSPSKVIYSGADKETANKSIKDLSSSGNTADFSNALREAASRQSSSYSYTLLISASPAALTSVLSGPQANLLKFSRVEEFNSWRALVVGLNLDSKVKKASTAFFAQ
jgi:hypothetical protein